MNYPDGILMKILFSLILALSNRREFLTAQQLNILEDTKAEQEDTQPFSPEKIDQQAAPANSTLAPPILGFVLKLFK